MKIAVQMWSLKDYQEKDFEATLQSVAKLGYDGVEFAGYFDYSAKQIRTMLDKYQLQIAGSHIGYERLQENLEEVIQFELEIQNKRLIIPYINFDSYQAWESFIQSLVPIRETLAKYGLQLLYHNHGNEIQVIDNHFIIEELAKVVQLELDVYWVKHAGYEPLELIKKFYDALAVLHIKDMNPVTRESCDLGDGELDIQMILKQKPQLEWMVVEQEHFAVDPMTSMAHNIRYLKSIGYE